MAKVRLPLLGLGASGTIGEAITYASWRGVDYARERVIPNNPQTASQTAVRGIFSNLSDIWTFMGALARAPWTLTASGRPITDRNLHVQRNLAALQGDINMNDYVGSPASNAPFVPANVVVTPGVTLLTVACDTPTLPTGWTVQAMVARALANRNPETGAFNEGPLQGEVEDTTAPYSTDITGLYTAEAYRVFVWFRLTSPEGDTRYSLVATGTGTPT